MTERVAVSLIGNLWRSPSKSAESSSARIGFSQVAGPEHDLLQWVDQQSPRADRAPCLLTELVRLNVEEAMHIRAGHQGACPAVGKQGKNLS